MFEALAQVTLETLILKTQGGRAPDAQGVLQANPGC